MSLIAYKEQRFARKSLDMIEEANKIISAYSAQGYNLTLRQLYYQFVSRNYFPNSEKSYNRLGETISNARLAGLISWEAIEDKTRNIRIGSHWDSAKDFLSDIKRYFAVDMWENQENYVEVWVEKDALMGVIERPCREYDVPYMACRGYMSQSEEWAAANRFEDAINACRDVTLIYLGDHDPSGMDMTRDHVDRMEMFLNHTGINIDVRRIALNMDQIERYRPPPNPTKITDSRSNGYIAEFGRECWELDALQPSVIDDLLRNTIKEYIDDSLWEERSQYEKEEKAKVLKAIESIDEKDK